MNILLNLLIVLHFAYHAIAAVGVAIGLVHSHRKHKQGLWKLVLAVLWLLVSVIVLFGTDHPVDKCNITVL